MSNAPVGMLLGKPLPTLLWRAAQLYAFWFFVSLVGATIYNEVVESDTMKSWTGASNQPYEDEENPEKVNTVRAIDGHQILSFSATFALIMVMLRMLFEGLYTYSGPETSALLSGHPLVEEPMMEYAQDDVEQLPEQQFIVQQPPPPPPQTLVQPPPPQQRMVVVEMPPQVPQQQFIPQQQQIVPQQPVYYAPPPVLYGQNKHKKHKR